MIRPLAIALVASIILLGCGQSGSGDTSSKGSGSTAETATETPGAGSGLSPGGDKGVGPIESIDVSSLDPSLARSGAETFQAKCTACHKIEERYIGPALHGVTKRRQPEWIMNMILNPDVMVKEDPVAKGLLAEYLAPMTNQNLTEEEARSILAFFMENDSMAKGEAQEESAE